MKNSYRLKRDLPDIKAGRVFIWNVKEQHYECRVREGDYYCYSDHLVRNRPEWFEEMTFKRFRARDPEPAPAPQAQQVLDMAGGVIANIRKIEIGGLPVTAADHRDGSITAAFTQMNLDQYDRLESYGHLLFQDTQLYTHEQLEQVVARFSGVKTTTPEVQEEITTIIEKLNF